jgi:hypothetical protein
MDRPDATPFDRLDADTRWRIARLLEQHHIGRIMCEAARIALEADLKEADAEGDEDRRFSIVAALEQAATATYAWSSEPRGWRITVPNVGTTILPMAEPLAVAD